MAPLTHKRIALLVEDLFEASELVEPRDLLRAAGAEVLLVGPFADRDFHDKTGTVVVRSDKSAGSLRGRDVDAVVIPGGYAPDKMRMRHAMVDLVRETYDAGKPVAAICHGPMLLISINAVRGRTITCWPSIAIDVKN